MRLIPKKSKLNSTVWKSFTLVDIIVIFLLFILAVVIAMSNLPGKWYVELVYVPLCVILFLPSDDSRAYAEIGHIIKFIFSRKRYDAAAKKPAQSIDALIPSCRILDDGVLDYGQYYGAVISVGSVEFGLLSGFQQNEHISAFAAVLNQLSFGQSAQLVKVDRPINFDEISALTFGKLQKLAAGEDVAKTLIMKSRLDQIDAINNVEKQYRPYYYVVFYAPDIAALDTLCDQAINMFSAAELQAERLMPKDVAIFLKYCYTRDFDEREIENVAPADYMDYVKPREVKFNLADYAADGKYAFTYAVSDYPLSVVNAWGGDLFNIDNTRVVLSIKPIDREQAVKRIDRTIVEIGSRSGGSKASEMIAQDTHLATMGTLLQSLQNENEALFDCTLTVAGFNNTSKSNSAFRKEIRQRIVTQGFRVNSLRCRQLDGFIAGSVTRRDPLKSFARGINSESLASVFPFVFTLIIEPQGMTLGESNGYPFIWDPWKWKTSSGEFVNANMFVAGTSGSGKSYFAKSLLSQLYSENSQIYILDPENEYKYLCRNVGGRFIDVGSAVTGRINPFHVYQVLSDNGEPAPPAATFSAHLQYLENFFAVTLPGIDQDTIEEINNLIVKCYRAKGITQDTDCSILSAEAYPIFDDLYKLVNSELKKEKGGMRYANLQRAEVYLAKFAAGGRFANLWNGASTLEAADKFTVFNFQSLFEAKNKVTSNGQMLTVLRFLEQQIINLREANAGRDDAETLHPVVVLDEGYNFIDAQNPCALDFVYQWYKRIRKYDGSMIFLTQNLADIVGNPEIVQKTSAIINNTQYSFVLTLQGKDVEVLQDIYASRNLTEVEIEEIQRSNKPKGTVFFMGSASQRAVVHIVTSDPVEALFSGEIDLKKVAFGHVENAVEEEETQENPAENTEQTEGNSAQNPEQIGENQTIFEARRRA